MEEFRNIKGYEGYYQISNLGNVKSLARKGSLTDRILKPTLNSRGYLVVPLCKDGKKSTKMIHQLVAITFLDHKLDGMNTCVDHIDNNPLNNNVDNLQLVTARLNTSKDRFRQNCSSQYIGVSWYKATRCWQAKIYINGKSKHLGYFHDELEASEAYQSALKQINK